MNVVAKNRGKIWKWARLLLEEKSVGPLRLVPLAAEGLDRQEILVLRAGEPVLTLTSDAVNITVTCPTGERPSWTLPVTTDELRTKDVMPRIVATLPPAAPIAPGLEEAATDQGTFGVVGRFAAKTGRNIGSRHGDYVFGRISVSPAGLARRATGELAVVDANDDPVLLERFYDAGVHPRLVPMTRIDGIAGTQHWQNALALPDRSIVFSGHPVRRWSADRGLRELPLEGEVVGCWSPRGSASWLFVADKALALADERVLQLKHPAGGRVVAAGTGIVWQDGQRHNDLWVSETSATGLSEAMETARRVVDAPEYGQEESRSFHIDENGAVLAYYGGHGHVVAEFDEGARPPRWRMWNASMASGYGHVQRYRQRGRLIVVVKTHGLVVVDRDAGERWLLREGTDYCFQHTCAAFAPSGQWLLVVGDETLYALTLGDYVLRRLATVPGVLDLVEHPDGFLLLGTDRATLVDATMLDAVVQRAPEVARLVVEKCSS